MVVTAPLQPDRWQQLDLALTSGNLEPFQGLGNALLVVAAAAAVLLG